MLVGVRIIAGSFRSRMLEAPQGVATRPTSDRLRETLFNVLAPRIEGAAFLDLFAGSGAVGMEALSRGAARVEFVEWAPAALKVLRGNLERLGITAGFRVHAGAVGAFLRRAAQASQEREQYEVVFLDPPWDDAEEYAATLGLLGGLAAGLLGEDAVVIAEHRRRERLEDRYGSLTRTRLLEQGDAALSFYAELRANRRKAASEGSQTELEPDRVRFQPARGEDRSLVSLIPEGNRVQFPLFSLSDEEILRFRGTKPPIVSGVTVNPLTAADSKRKMTERGKLSRLTRPMEGK